MDSVVVIFLIVSETSILLFSIVAEQIYIPISSAQVFPFLHIFSNTYNVVLLSAEQQRDSVMQIHISSLF